MNLLMVSSDTAAARGRETAFWNTLAGLAESWERIDVICPAVDGTVQSLFGRVHFHPLPPARVAHPVNVYRACREVAATAPPDLVTLHAFGLQLMSWGAWQFSRRSRVPLVIELHHVDGLPRAAGAQDHLRRLMTRLFVKRAWRSARMIRVVNGGEIVTWLRSLGVAEERIRVLHAIYLDLDVFRPQPDCDARYDLVFVGRLEPNKNLPLLLDTFDLVRRTRPRATLLIMGGGSLGGWLRDQIAGNDAVTHVESVASPADVAEIYNQARVVICTSDSEGGPRFVLEAMACGLPAVSTPVGLMNELLADGAAGRVTATWEASELAPAVLSLLASDESYRRASGEAVAIAGRFDRRRTLATYAAEYRKLAEECAS